MECGQVILPSAGLICVDIWSYEFADEQHKSLKAEA